MAASDSTSDDASSPPAPGAKPATTVPSTPAYRERLRTPLWWYPVALLSAALLAAEFHISGMQITDWLSYGILLPVAVIIVWTFGRSDLVIADGEISIRQAHLSLRYVSGAVELDARTLRRVLGPEGDPAAFVCTWPFIGPGVQIWIDDADDPTPYWVVSTRNPRRVVELLTAAASATTGTAPKGTAPN